jgi:hypothetical protein
MTPAEFLASKPRDHPDFVGCDDPRCEPANKAGKDGTILMPNLVELIRRIGGVDAIPDDWTDDFKPFYFHDEPRGAAWWAECRGREQVVMLKDLRSRRPYLTLYRWRNSLHVEDWHPRGDFLALIFGIPADWSASAWELPFVSIMDVHTASYDLDRLAAETLDYWIGAIRKATETYVHVRRDRFVF